MVNLRVIARAMVPNPVSLRDQGLPGRSGAQKEAGPERKAHCRKQSREVTSSEIIKYTFGLKPPKCQGCRGWG